MSTQESLAKLIAEMQPRLNPGEYVFCATNDLNVINRSNAIGRFQEQEGTTIIIEKRQADELKLDYDYVAAWITLEVHSSLNAVGLTASFSSALAENNISCNVMAGFHHDHLFVDHRDRNKALEVLNKLSEKAKDAWINASD